ncbi:hypothetical protein [Clostridium sp. E02]|uniref:hypothetical protein n=1 Tax=Clostridium sp. E02 TaxID=2487134 RepID=UPI000F53221F|nr:hypothetical protein [Clostridium sp. E02]
MSSTNKTSLGLNMWEASDKPVRQDFVNDNTIIDEKITNLNSNLAIKYLADGTDINTLTETGKYRVYKGVNSPFDNSIDGDVLVITEKIWDGTIYQKVISLWSSRKTVERLLVMGTWQEMRNKNLDNITSISDDSVALNLFTDNKKSQIKFYPDSNTLYVTFFDGSIWHEKLLANFNN